jgi:hypothetical protein
MPFGKHSVLGKELTRAWGAGLDGHRDALILTGYACGGWSGHAESTRRDDSNTKIQTEVNSSLSV